MATTTKPTVLHIGDPIKYNPETYALFSSQFNVIRPSAAERERPAFMRALRERRWGDFHAIFRPFWGTGGEMGNWDEELISLLPPSVRVFASAGAGFDWANTELLGKRGEFCFLFFFLTLLFLWFFFSGGTVGVRTSTYRSCTRGSIIPKKPHYTNENRAC